MSIHGKARVTGSTRFCGKWSAKLECKDKVSGPDKPDYYLLECDRNRRICDRALAVFLPSGEPWLVKVEYRINSWTRERISATMDSEHPCVITTLQIDLESKEVIFTETYTKTVDYHPSCVPENIGHTTTYKLEDY